MLLLDRPYLLLPLFLMEELGLPVALVSSAVFVYAGSVLATGTWQALSLVLVNLLGSLIGSTAVYWLARGGTHVPLWRTKIEPRLPGFITSLTTEGKRVDFFAVLASRMAPLPLVLGNAAFGAIKLPYFPFACGVVVSTLIWNVIFLGAGLAGGLVSARAGSSPPLWLRYGPGVLAWLLITGALIWYSRRHGRKTQG